MKEEKKVSFPVTPQEHERIKQLAQKERRTIKLLFFNALDKLYPCLLYTSIAAFVLAVALGL